MRLAFVGGTGPLGRGLGLRLARAGHEVILGSRDALRAKEKAAQIGAAGAQNADACREGDLVFVTVPYDAQADTLPALADVCRDKIVVSTAVPLSFDERGPHRVFVDEGSAAEQCQALLPGARVVAGFQLVPAPKLLQVDALLAMDVPLCSDDDDALTVVAELAEQVEALRPVAAGPVRLASSVEGLTPLLLSVNKRYKAHTGVRFVGLPQDA